MSNDYGIFHSFVKKYSVNTHLYLGDGRTKMFPVKDEDFKGLLFSHCEDGVNKETLTLDEAYENEVVTLLFDNKESLSNTIELLKELHSKWEGE